MRADHSFATIERLVLLALTIIISGCGESGPKVAEVDGVLTIGGQPGHKVLIEFLPEPGTDGPSSSAETDDEGHFVLQLQQKGAAPRPGAVVGTHRVVFSDIQLAESPTGKGVPVRIDAKYTMPSSTPMSQNVVDGKNHLELKLP